LRIVRIVRVVSVVSVVSVVRTVGIVGLERSHTEMSSGSHDQLTRLHQIGPGESGHRPSVQPWAARDTLCRHYDMSSVTMWEYRASGYFSVDRALILWCAYRRDDVILNTGVTFQKTRRRSTLHGRDSLSPWGFRLAVRNLVAASPGLCLQTVSTPFRQLSTCPPAAPSRPASLSARWRMEL